MSSFKLKTLVIGAAATGKTSLLQRFIKNRFAENYKLTVGVDILTKDIEFSPGEIATLSLWELGGQQRFEFIRSTFYKGAAGAMVIFDWGREQTFEEAKRWIAEFKHFAGKSTPFLLIRNKSDLIEKVGSLVSEDDISQFIQKYDAKFMDTSAKENINVVECFTELTRIIIENRSQVQPIYTTKSKRIQDLETNFVSFFEESKQNYIKIKNMLDLFKEIQDIEEYDALNLIYNKAASLSLNNPAIFLIKLYLLKLLYNYSRKKVKENLLLDTAEISEKIALECYKSAFSIPTSWTSLAEVTQSEMKSFIETFKELFSDIETHNKSIADYIIEVFSHFLLNAYLLFLHTNYNKIKNLIYEEDDKELFNIIEYKALLELANFNPYYYELIKDLFFILENQDIEYLDNTFQDYLRKRRNIPRDSQVNIGKTFKDIEKSLPKIKITEFIVKDQIIEVDKTYIILEVEIKNNTLRETLNFKLQIEPVGFENFSPHNLFIRNYRLKPKETSRIFLDLGRAKTKGKCPICFSFSYKKGVHNPVYYLDVKDRKEELSPRDIQIKEIRTQDRKSAGYNTIILELVIKNYENKGCAVRLAHNGSRYFGNKPLEVNFHCDPNSTLTKRIMIDLSTEKMIKSKKYPIIIYLLDVERNLLITEHEIEVQIKPSKGRVIWEIVRGIAQIAKPII